MHKELKAAIKLNNLDKICQFLNTEHFESDSDFTRMRSNEGFKQGWKERGKYEGRKRWWQFWKRT